MQCTTESKFYNFLRFFRVNYLRQNIADFKEFTEKYLAENARRTLSAVNEELEPQSELSEEHINAGVDMPPTIRRNSGSGGAYTSYVFISNDQAGGGDDVGSVVSSTGSYGESGGDNRVTVNVKENTRLFKNGGSLGFLAKFSKTKLIHTSHFMAKRHFVL